MSDFSWGFTWGIGSGELRWFEATSFFSSGFSFPPVVSVLAGITLLGQAQLVLNCVPAGWMQLPGCPGVLGWFWESWGIMQQRGLRAAPCLQVCTAAPFLDLKLSREGTRALEWSAWERDGVALGDMIIAVLGSARLIVRIYDLGGLSNRNNSMILWLWPCWSFCSTLLMPEIPLLLLFHRTLDWTYWRIHRKRCQHASKVWESYQQQLCCPRFSFPFFLESL